MTGACPAKRHANQRFTCALTEPSYPHLMLADAVAREGILLAARELVVLLVVVGFIAWVGYRFVREGHR